MTERSERTVTRGPAELSVQERGSATSDRPTVVLVHGWPDSHAVWDLVVAELGDRFHVVTFDLRGVGGSTLAPGTPHAYALEELVADLDAVIEAVSPDRPVHLVGHDWGSIQSWDLVADPIMAERVASFTSVSGPGLDQLGAFLRDRLRHPSPAGLAPVAEQGLRSSYTLLLSTPVLPRLLLRAGLDRAFRRWLQRSEGLPAEAGYPGPGLAADAAALLPIYRQNLAPRLRRPDPRPALVPVQLVVNRRDPAISPKVLVDVERWAPDLTRRELDAGHWSPRSHPEELAALIAEFVVAVENEQARPEAVEA